MSVSIPAPDREGVKRRFVEAPLEAVDVGWCVGRLRDGRPYRAEHTRFCGANYLTVYFLAVDFPEINDAAFATWLADEGLVRWGGAGPYAVAGRDVDQSGQPIWWVRTGEDWTAFESLLEMQPYPEDAEPVAAPDPAT
ncbi:hypothetical protein R5W24_006579 [Gemmata sp. JC717]|uniref:hypothetical protein n=1 Tax=Gemmata algarum TaxID=2975278 RepID=UPI0021BAA33D|nr:hypothetical protein [Gemmata algarum]MDY3557388.1 hypothetical protein [Gemmata algarum]